jgi:hypothetical protein
VKACLYDGALRSLHLEQGWSRERRPHLPRSLLLSSHEPLQLPSLSWPNVEFSLFGCILTLER